MTKTGHLSVVLGPVLTYVGLFKSIVGIGSLSTVVLWGAVALLGVFLLALGAKQVLTELEPEPDPSPEDLLNKTETRYGPR